MKRASKMYRSKVGGQKLALLHTLSSNTKEDLGHCLFYESQQELSQLFQIIERFLQMMRSL